MIPTSARSVPALTGVLLWAAAAAVVGAQDEAPPISEAPGFAERIEVELVNVDVWVTDGQGDPVTGLGAADFELFHDGRPVTIMHFTEVRAGVAAAAPGPATAALGSGETGAVSPDATPAHVVVYLDRSRLAPANYPALIRGLEQLLAAEAIEPERVLILRQDQSLAVEAPLGSSRQELEQALTRLGQGTAGGLDLAAETRLALDAIRSAWEQSQDVVGSAATSIAAIPTTPGAGTPPGVSGGSPRSVVGGPGSGTSSGPDACGPFLNLVQPILDSWTRSQGQRVAVTLSNLSDAVSFLAGLPGVKALLYLSDGLDIEPGAALATYASGLCPAAAADLLNSALSEEMTGRFLELTRHANSNRVTLYSLQATGLQSTSAGDASAGRRARGEGIRSRSAFESRKRAAEREGLGMIAEETGGRAVFNQNEFGAALRRIGQDLQSYYSLAYEPPAAGGAAGQRDHRIELRVGDGTLVSRYRRGYREKDRTRWLTERIEGALYLGIVSNPLEVRLGAGEEKTAADGSLRLPLYVMVPAERLAFLPRDGAFVTEVTVRILVRSFGTGALAMRDESFRVKGSPGATGWVSLPVELELGPGAHLAAVGVLDGGTGEASFVSTTLQVGPGG